MTLRRASMMLMPMLVANLLLAGLALAVPWLAYPAGFAAGVACMWWLGVTCKSARR